MIVDSPWAILSYRAHGQTGKTITDYHEDFEQVQSESEW